jgi:hypothetical protein
MSPDELRRAVAAAVNGTDVSGLLAAGAPADEYDAQVGDLVGLLRTGEPITIEHVRDVWTHWFGADVAWNEERGAELARQLAVLVGSQTLD